MKKYKLKKSVKENLITMLIIISIIVSYILITNTIHNAHQEQLQQQANEYKTCIIEQANEKGYIIRSSCSNNYKQLDKVANLEYTQKGYDLYLK